MRRTFEWWGTLLFIFWLDSLIPPLEWGMGFRPALLGLFVVIWGFRRGPQEGAILGLVIGLFLDALGPFVFFHSILLALAGVLSGLLRERILDFPLIPTAILAAAGVAIIRGSDILLFIIYRWPVPNAVSSTILGEFIGNAVVALAFYPIVSALDRRWFPPALEFGRTQLLN